MKLNFLGKAKRCLRMKKVLRFFGNLLITAVLILSIVMTVAVITSVHSEKVHLPNLFGYAMLSVQTDSMEGENGFNAGDVIIVRLLDAEEANNLSVGDVISFIRSLDGQDYLETHRIVSCEGDKLIPPQEIIDGIWQRGETRYYTTKGDNTPGIDKVYGSDVTEYTSCTKIYGIWTGTRVPKLGTVMDFLQSSMGFMICVVLPVALFFIYQLYIFIMTLTRRQKEKALEEVSSKEEELKKKAIAEFLAQQQANGGAPADLNTTPATPAAPEAPPEPEGKKKRKNKHVKEEPAESAEPATSAESEETETPEPAEESAEPATSAESEAAETPEPAEEPAEPATSAESEEGETPEPPAEKTESASADDAPAISEEEKNRIIQEYLAKQAQEKKD